jgi:hypothetical protein
MHNKTISQTNELTTLRNKFTEVESGLDQMKTDLAKQMNGGDEEGEGGVPGEEAFMNNAGELDSILGQLSNAKEVFGQLLAGEGNTGGDNEGDSDDECDSELSDDKTADNSDDDNQSNESTNVSDTDSKNVANVENNNNKTEKEEEEEEDEIIEENTIEPSVDDEIFTKVVNKKVADNVILTTVGIKKMTVDELKKELKNRGLPINGNKPTLMSRLTINAKKTVSM